MDRWNRWIRTLVAVAAVAFLVIAAGCAKKPKPATDVTEEPIAQTDTTGQEAGQSDDSQAQTDQTLAAEIEDIFFDYDKHRLRDDARRILEANARTLQSDPTVNLILEGHCDERGTVEYDLALGERRAQSVKSYLEQFGIDPSRVRTVSYGEERPFALGHDEPAWSQNRRVHFVKQ